MYEPGPIKLFLWADWVVSSWRAWQRLVFVKKPT